MGHFAVFCLIASGARGSKTRGIPNVIGQRTSSRSPHTLSDIAWRRNSRLLHEPTASPDAITEKPLPRVPSRVVLSGSVTPRNRASACACGVGEQVFASLDAHIIPPGGGTTAHVLIFLAHPLWYTISVTRSAVWRRPGLPVVAHNRASSDSLCVQRARI